MTIKELDKKLLELLTIQNNFKKSINKDFLYKTLIEKQQISKKLYKEIQAKTLQLAELLTQEKIDEYKDIASESYQYIQEIILTKLNNSKKPIKFKPLVKTIITVNSKLKKVKMTTAAEVIKITSSLIPQYDGNGDKLTNIIAALTALQVIVTATTEPTAVQIILSKLEKKAKSAVGKNPANIEAIKNALTQKCKQHISSDVVLAKLNATRQTGALNKFTGEIEELTTQLETAYIHDDIPIDTATKMANKAGIKALAKGLKSQNSQTIIKAGTFASLHEAIGRAAENDTDPTPTVGMLYYSNNRGRGNYRGNSSRGYQQGRGGRYFHSNRQGNNEQWRQNNYQRNSNGHNSNYQRNNPSRGRVYHATGDNERNDRQDEENRQQNDFLERADQVNRSSQ